MFLCSVSIMPAQICTNSTFGWTCQSSEILIETPVDPRWHPSELWKAKILKTFGEVYYSGFWRSENSPYWMQRRMFQMTSSSYLHHSRAPQNVLMLMIYIRKRSARWVIYELEIYIESAPVFQITSQLPVISRAFWKNRCKITTSDCDAVWNSGALSM